MDIQQKQSSSLVIFTDLDGTLLDHDNYSWQPASPALEKARQLAVPVIPCTSKTRTETQALVSELALDTPYIVENGSALVSPTGEITPLAPIYPEQLQKLEQLKADQRFQFRGFSEMNVADICDATGLSTDAAEKAKAREFSEPFLWLGAASDLPAFNKAAAQLGLNIISGGRFFHALEAGISKNNALRHLLKRMHMEHFHIVGLGDSDNDIPMLEAADTAVVINSPTKPFPIVKTKNPIYHTCAYGPVGWNSAILTLLEEHHG